MLELKKIEDSYQRIKKYLKPTRLEESLNLSDEENKVYLSFYHFYISFLPLNMSL